MNRGPWIGTWLVPVVLLVLATGCASPKERFYTLSATPPSAFGNEAGFSVAITSVTIPEIVDRPQFVVRKAPNRVEIAEFDRWAEPLAAGISRVFAQDLARELGTPRIAIRAQAISLDADYQVTVDVLRFDAMLGDGVTFEALWRVRAAKGGSQRIGRSVVQEPVQASNYETLAAAHSRALQRCAREIAAAIRALQ
jgi:uncharacterized lipoprotein YmbA